MCSGTLVVSLSLPHPLLRFPLHTPPHSTAHSRTRYPHSGIAYTPHPHQLTGLEIDQDRERERERGEGEGEGKGRGRGRGRGREVRSGESKGCDIHQEILPIYQDILWTISTLCVCIYCITMIWSSAFEVISDLVDVYIVQQKTFFTLSYDSDI